MQKLVGAAISLACRLGTPHMARRRDERGVRFAPGLVPGDTWYSTARRKATGNLFVKQMHEGRKPGNSAPLQVQMPLRKPVGKRSARSIEIPPADFNQGATVDNASTVCGCFHGFAARLTRDQQPSTSWLQRLPRI